MGGSSSKSTSSQTTNNTSTSIGVEGDNNGYITNGNGNSYNITQTDHGLVDGLIGIWGDMNGNVAEMGATVGDIASDNAYMTENVTSNAFDFAGDVNRDSLDFANDNAGMAFNFGNDSLDAAGRAQDSAFDFGINALDAMGGAQDNAFDFGNNALDAMGGAQDSAFDFARDTQSGMLDIMAGSLGFGSDALAANSNLASDSINAQNALADTAIAENSDLAYAVIQSAENMHGNNTAFANNALLTTTGAIENANQGMADLAYYSIDNNSNLAAALAEGAVDKISEAYNNAGDQTILAHKQAMQFADHASRSDGQQLAISTNKSMTYIVIGLGGVAILALFMGRK